MVPRIPPGVLARSLAHLTHVMMTLGNMRENGERSLAITCGALWCHRPALDVSGYADDVTVPSLGPRMVCTMCGAVGADARPNWNERVPVSLFCRNP